MSPARLAVALERLAPLGIAGAPGALSARSRPTGWADRPRSWSPYAVGRRPRGSSPRLVPRRARAPEASGVPVLVVGRGSNLLVAGPRLRRAGRGTSIRTVVSATSRSTGHRPVRAGGGCGPARPGPPVGRSGADRPGVGRRSPRIGGRGGQDERRGPRLGHGPHHEFLVPGRRPGCSGRSRRPRGRPPDLSGLAVAEMDHSYRYRRSGIRASPGRDLAATFAVGPRAQPTQAGRPSAKSSAGGASINREARFQRRVGVHQPSRCRLGRPADRARPGPEGSALEGRRWFLPNMPTSSQAEPGGSADDVFGP